MTTLTLKDLSHFDDLDRAASQSVHGGNACLRREPSDGCHGGYAPPVVVRPIWGGCPPIHIGGGPVIMPYWNMPQPERVVTPV
jgi:hypothetical protein